MNDVELFERFGITPAAELLNNAADAMARKGHSVAALTAMRRADALCPNNAFLLAGLGAVLWDAGRYAEGEAVLRRALVIDPLEARAHGNLATVLSAQRRFDEAVAHHKRSIDLNPKRSDARWNYAACLLDAGRWDEGLIAFESRFTHRPDRYPKLAYPMWEGEDLNGKTLYVQAEQGVGDRILFSRYLRWIKDRWPECRIKCLMDAVDLPSLVNLMWGYSEFVEFLPNGIPWPQADYGIHLMSVPRIHGTTLENIPDDPGLIRSRVLRERGECTLPSPHVPAIKVGVCWAGNANMARNADRSIPLELMLGLEELPNVQLYSLQFPPGSSDLDRLGARDLIADFTQDLAPRGLVGTATMMLELDLVVTVCTSVAHLAGALGVPCWTLLCANHYWVWGRQSHTPWYPGMTLYRQDTQGTWSPVIESVKRDLSAIADVTMKVAA